MQKQLLYGTFMILFFLYLSVIPTEGFSCEFCNYNATFDIIQKIFPVCGIPSCDSVEKKKIAILKKDINQGMNVDLFKIEISNDDGYDGNENDSLYIAIKSADAVPIRKSFINNYKIGNYTGYYGMGTYSHPNASEKVHVFQFKLPDDSKPQAGKLVTMKLYGYKGETEKIFEVFSLKSKEIQ